MQCRMTYGSVSKRIGSEASLIFSESQNSATIVARQDDQDDSGDFGVAALRNLSRHRMTIADTAKSFILTLLIVGT